MSEKKLGRQTPTQSVVLPYSESLGQQAIDLYNQSGRTAQEWQELQLEDIMAVNDDGLWVHMKYGYSIPRRNGKSEILIMLECWAITHGLRVLHTAHRTTTSHSTWEKAIERLTKAGFVEKDDFKTTKQFGLERIEWLKGDNQGIINFRTRSSKGGLGEGYDLLIIDEAQEYTADQETALKYVVTDSKNPQTIMCGTPPTTVSSGTVFLQYRRDTLQGKNSDAGWAEWSVPELTDAHNSDLWYECNPSLGSVLSERAIRSELGDDQVDDNIQRLGLWLSYNQKSAISRKEWQEYKLDGRPQLHDNPKLYIGIKYARATTNVSLAVAVKTKDNRIFVEAIDCRPTREGNDWIIAYLLNPHISEIVIDGANGQTILEADMKNAGIKKKPILPKVIEIIEACSQFEKSLFADKTICHSGQASLEQIIANCEHRAIGSGGGFGYTSIMEGADVSLLEAVTLAHWACANAKEKKTKQKVSY